MNIQQKLYAALQALAGGRVYPNTLPQSPTYPAIAYQFISNPPADTFSAGVRITNFHAQITLHTLDVAGLSALRKAVLTAVEAMTEHIVRDTDIESPFEFETKTYSWILGFHLRDAET